MRVLGIESSCDETAAAVVTEDGEVLTDVVASQIAMHGPYGGIVPELASRAHMQAIIPVIREAVAGLEGGLDAIDAIAVTEGPGLVGSLLVGVQVAKALAWSLGKPLVGVNHLDGHLAAVYLRRSGRDEPVEVPELPFVGLLVSGGHTALYRVDSFADIELLAQTRDDAAGEAFDKGAKLLGLPYPGGPHLAVLAEKGQPGRYRFPRPMLKSPDLNFSFSGLKTALAVRVRDLEADGQLADAGTADRTRADLAASYQQAIIDTLVGKSLRALAATGHRRLVVAGGVGANRSLREHFRAELLRLGGTVYYPRTEFCTDNGAMIAFTGCQRLSRAPAAYTSIRVEARPRWPLEELTEP